jgi:predicted DNA binding protein
MAHACIRIELSEGRWKADVSRNHPDVSLRVLGMVLGDDRAVETITISGCTIVECLSDIDTHPDVDAFDVVDQRTSRATAQVETLEPSVLSTASEAGTPLVYPAAVHREELTATIIGSRAAISALGDRLRGDDLRFEVAYIHSDHDVSQVLTDRQEEVLFIAVKNGYYKSPRGCTLTELADVLNIAKSTCSATLQRAEEAIVEYFCLQQRRPDQVPTESQSLPVDGH